LAAGTQWDPQSPETWAWPAQNGQEYSVGIAAQTASNGTPHRANPSHFNAVITWAFILPPFRTMCASALTSCG